MQSRKFYDGVAQVADSLKDLKDSVHAHWEAEEKRHETKPVSVADLRTDVPIQVQTEPKRSKPENVWRYIIGTLEAAAFIAIIVYTIVAYNQWHEMIKATKASTDAAHTAACALDENRRQFKDTLTEIQKQTVAQQNASTASWLSAQTAKKQSQLIAQQMEQTERQVSAKLVFQNFTVEKKFAVENSPEQVTVSFDVVNVGGSAATEIGIGEGGGELKDTIAARSQQQVSPDPSGFSLDKGQSHHFTQDATGWRAHHGIWGSWLGLAYVNVLQKTDCTCALVVGHKYTLRLHDCSYAPAPDGKPYDCHSKQ